MNTETLERMRVLRLFGMHDAFKTNLETSLKESMTPDQFIHYLVTCEADDRRNRAVARAVKQANFRYKASLEEIDYSIDRGLDKNQVHRLAALDFIKEHKDLFITGSTGTGKSYLATAIGYHACQEGYKVMYVNTAKLMGQLKLAKAKGTILAGRSGDPGRLSLVNTKSFQVPAGTSTTSDCNPSTRRLASLYSTLSKTGTKNARRS